MDLRGLAFAAISGERKRQDDKFGEQNHGDLYWLAILLEEVGEAAQAIIQERAFNPRNRDGGYVKHFFFYFLIGAT